MCIVEAFFFYFVVIFCTHYYYWRNSIPTCVAKQSGASMEGAVSCGTNVIGQKIDDWCVCVFCNLLENARVYCENEKEKNVSFELFCWSGVLKSYNANF